MRIFKKAAVSTTAVGLLAFGAVAGGGGAAFAGATPSQNAVVTGCATTVTVAAGLTPICEAANAATEHPTAIYIYVDAESLATPTGVHRAVTDVQGMDASWTLSCVVNGAAVQSTGSFDITAASLDPFHEINLMGAVGSPEPNECTVEDLTVTTAYPLTGSEPSPYHLAVAAVATNATPGAIHQDEGTTSTGAHAVLCADDASNGNAGARIQSFQCLSDLADAFVQTSTSQLVHNGDCVSVTTGGYAFLAKCVAKDKLQQWVQSMAGDTVKNMSTGTCLTAPSAKSGVQLTVKSCGSGASQKWDIPAMAAVPVPPNASDVHAWHLAR